MTGNNIHQITAYDKNHYAKFLRISP